jgi:ribosomal-protein-alanine N-acetyltransferase
MTPPETIRLAPTLAGVAAALHRASGFSETWDESAFVALLAMTGADGLLAVDREMPVGLVLWRTAADEAEILTICVPPPYRRHGVGRLLLGEASAAAVAAGATTLFLEVAVDNDAAIALYRGCGFRERGRRAGYYASFGGLTDALVLAKEFPGRSIDHDL